MGCTKGGFKGNLELIHLVGGDGPADAAVIVEGVAGADDAAADLAAEVDVEGEDGSPSARFRRHRHQNRQIDEEAGVHLVCWPKSTRPLKIALNHCTPTH